MNENDAIATTSVRLLIQQCRSRSKRGLATRKSILVVQCRLSTLPLELQYMIMDYLDFQDICTMKRCILWTVADGYWKSRPQRGLFYEVDQILEEDLDWMWLCLKLELIKFPPPREGSEAFLQGVEGVSGRVK
ncbi:hypothetical protein BO71DRAFT_357420 [Aspergillus ellipticus CBS 707.79]|uniref:F-box domain-containing protein n=1 Tax=Aspergillus ellipticus CBS 707.79 TaxID=1448320 RepID=A0A319DW61_9EURO|nr:hypothetical protein BO71DRAFT_357420 [Aspergillus ellipticus CBS 707.79]